MNLLAILAAASNALAIAQTALPLILQIQQSLTAATGADKKAAVTSLMTTAAPALADESFAGLLDSGIELGLAILKKTNSGLFAKAAGQNILAGAAAITTLAPVLGAAISNTATSAAA